MNSQAALEKADRGGDPMRVVCDSIGNGHKREWKIATFNRGIGKENGSVGLWLSNKTSPETNIFAIGGVIPDSGPDVHSTVTLECPKCKRGPKVMLRGESLQRIFDGLASAGMQEVSITRLADIVARKRL